MEDADDTVEESDAAAVAPAGPSPAVGTAVAVGARDSGTGKLAGTKRPLSPSHEAGEGAAEAEAEAAAGPAADAGGKAAAMQDGGLQAPTGSSLSAKRPRLAGSDIAAAPASASA